MQSGVGASNAAAKINSIPTLLLVEWALCKRQVCARSVFLVARFATRVVGIVLYIYGKIKVVHRSTGIVDKGRWPLCYAGSHWLKRLVQKQSRESRRCQALPADGGDSGEL